MNRFWKRNYVYHEGNPNMVITTREIGDVPGCVPAVDVFIERTLVEVRSEIANDPAWKAFLAGDRKDYNRQPRRFTFSR